jgi:hypothetical protein
VTKNAMFGACNWPLASNHIMSFDIRLLTTLITV